MNELIKKFFGSCLKIKCLQRNFLKLYNKALVCVSLMIQKMMKSSMTYCLHDLISCAQFESILQVKKSGRETAQKQCDKFQHAMCKTLIYRPSRKSKQKLC